MESDWNVIELINSFNPFKTTKFNSNCLTHTITLFKSKHLNLERIG